MTKHADLVPIYKRSRKAGIRLNQKLVDALSTEILKEGGRRLGILRNDALVFGSEDETNVLMDYCIFNVYTDGLNTVQRYLAESPPPRNSEEMALIQVWLEAYYSIFKVIEVERGVGVLVTDLLRNDSDFIIDIGLGNSLTENTVIASRVLPIHGCLMTGGAALPVSGTAMTKIAREMKRIFHPETDVRRLTPDQESDLAATMIRICLESGMGSRIAYERPDQPAAPRKQTSDARSVRVANRNDPCPCGSGRKYKTCCGRRPLR